MERGRVALLGHDISRMATPATSDVELDPEEAKSLLRDLSVTLPHLTPPSEAEFLPDSLVGSITLEVGELKIMRYFLPSKIDREAQGKELPDVGQAALDRFSRMSRQVLPRRPDA